MELYIGSHLSTAGGWNALLERSHEEGGTAFAFFPRSPYGKRSKALDPAGAAAFGARLKAEGYGPLVVHAPYVYNLAGKDEAKRTFAIEALAEYIELLTAIREAGQEVYINIHPGAHVGQGTETGCRLISEGLNQVFERTTGVMVLLETMAGKGSEIGRNFEELAAIYEGVRYNDKLRVCFDTCHVHDAGYDIVHDFSGVMSQFDKVIGQDQIAVFHVNDSKNPCGAHKDRHENFGFGEIGFEALMQVVNCPDFEQIPKILETPYIPDAENKKKSYAPYKFEIEMIRKGLFDAQLKEKILQAAK